MSDAKPIFSDLERRILASEDSEIDREHDKRARHADAVRRWYYRNRQAAIAKALKWNREHRDQYRRNSRASYNRNSGAKRSKYERARARVLAKREKA